MVRNRRFAAFSTMCVVAAACAAFDAPPAFAQFVQQGPKLVGSGAAANAKQGDSVSLSADGNTAIVGGPSDNSGFGAAWIWTRSGGAWTVARRLSGSNLVGFAGQGRSVSISADGNTALVGGPYDNGNTGAAWVWTRSGDVWIQQGLKLVGSGAVGAAQQGSSVSLSSDGNTAIVGGATDDNTSGAAWVWTRSGGVWTQQGLKLVGSGAVVVARQGFSVSLSADGNTAVVGGPYDNVNRGAAWVWTRSGGLWSQQGSKLVGSGAVGSANQGVTVSLSVDGNTALVGGHSDNGFSGAAWVWTRSGGEWTQQGSKLVGTGAAGGASQGYSVALSADGDTAIVGGSGDTITVGAAWVWTRSGGIWAQQGTKLVGSGAIGGARQGSSVALSSDGSTALVGGPFDDSNSFGGTGAGWVWTRSGGTWTQQGPKLAVAKADQGDSVSVSADGDIAIVGGSSDRGGLGAAWIWTRSGGAWTQGPKLVGSGAAGYARQGTSVSISADGNTAVVGGNRDNFSSGAAWVWTRSGGVWTQQGQKLVGSGAVGQGCQGSSVSLSADGSTALVGAPCDNSAAGAAWVWTRSGGVWTQQGPKLVGSGAIGTTQQGYSVSLSADGNTAVIGGNFDNNGAGAGWVWTRNGGLWTQQGAKLAPAACSGELGVSVSLSGDGNTAIVGAYRNGANVGAACVWTRNVATWSQQGGALVGSGAVGLSQQGWSVSISNDGNTALVGGHTDNGFSGAAWVWTRSGGVWTQRGPKLVGSGTGTFGAAQGESVALSADAGTAIVGGRQDDGGAGAAWVFVAPTVAVTPVALQFGATKNGAAGAITASTPGQPVAVTFSSSAPAWTVSANQPWVQLSTSGGTGAGAFTASIINPGNVLGASTNAAATITVSAPGAINAPKTITVTLTIDQTNGGLTPAFGQVDTPSQNAAGVQGAIGVTGWALDNIGVSDVQLYRNCLAFENQASCQMVLGNNVVFVGNAAFLTGARPDVEAAFASHPQNTRAGWGYLLLTSMLPHVPNAQSYGGQGPLTLYAVATDVEGNQTLLGRSSDPASPDVTTPTSIVMANDTIAKPFGAIDTPAQGETISGLFNNFGWALTPDTDTTNDPGDILIPTNGSTMTVFIDGLPKALVAFNQCRGDVGNPVPAGVYCNDDVANIFGNVTPQPVLSTRTSNPTLFRNLDMARAAIGAYSFDTTTLSNGLHTIAWSVTDSAGRTEGIGSRFFMVLNAGTSASSGGGVPATEAQVRGEASALSDTAPITAGVFGRTGFDIASAWKAMHAKDDRTYAVRVPELGRVELWLGAPVEAAYLVANGTLRPLPVGSTVAGSVFAWMPPAGYLGSYRFAFLRGEDRIDATVTIVEKPRVIEGEAQIRMGAPSAQVLKCSGAAGHKCSQNERVVRVEGWAFDPLAAIGSGIGAVHVWAVRTDVAVRGSRTPGVRATGSPFFLGEATLEHSEFSLTASLAPGSYELTAYVWNERTARWEDARSIAVVVK